MRVRARIVVASLFVPSLLAQASDPLRAARDLVMEREFARALPLLQEHLKEHPRDVPALEMRLLCETWVGRFEDGVETGDALIENGNHSATTHAQRGFCHNGLGDRAAAEKDFRKALELDPEHTYALSCLAGLLSNTDPRAALKHYDRLVELAPENAEYWQHRGKCAAWIGAFAAARDSYRAAGERGGPMAGFYAMEQASAEWHLGLDDRAVDTLRRMADDSGSDFDRVLLGKMQWQTGREADAQLQFEQVHRSGEGDDAQLARKFDAMMRLALGEHAAAVALLEKDAPLLGPHHSFENALALWCARRAAGADGADDALSAFAADYQRHPAWVRAPVDFATRICLDEHPPAPSAYEPSEHAAMHCYLAAFRARLEGDTQRADDLLLQCANTGVLSSQWWYAARTELCRRHGVEAFEKCLGFRAEAVGAGDTRSLRVTELDARTPPPPGLLAVGDRIVEVMEQPITSDWPPAVEPRPVGSHYSLRVVRGSETFNVRLPVRWRFKAE